MNQFDKGDNNNQPQGQQSRIADSDFFYQDKQRVQRFADQFTNQYGNSGAQHKNQGSGFQQNPQQMQRQIGQQPYAGTQGYQQNREPNMGNSFSQPNGNTTGAGQGMNNTRSPKGSDVVYKYGYGGGSGGNSGGGGSEIVIQKKKHGWIKGLAIFLIIAIVVMIAGYGCTSQINKITGKNGQNDSSAYVYSHDYVGMLYLEGTISEGDSGDGYNQGWILDRISQMTDDEHNKGILLSVNTPGGSAFATYDVYTALNKYKEITGNPIYVYMDSQATSGGYYVSMAGEKIYAHPECWTGSIGVILGTLYDFSGLFEKYGVKAYSITSGPNKDIAANYKPMSEEQKQIMQSLVDDSYDRFIKAVCAGRGFDETKARALGDGRVYAASQAKENGLVDEIGTIDDAINDMASQYGLDDISFEPIYYTPEQTLLQALTGMEASDLSRKNEIESLLEMIQEGEGAELQYIAPVHK